MIYNSECIMPAQIPNANHRLGDASAVKTEKEFNVFGEFVCVPKNNVNQSHSN